MLVIQLDEAGHRPRRRRRPVLLPIPPAPAARHAVAVAAVAARAPLGPRERREHLRRRADALRAGSLRRLSTPALYAGSLRRLSTPALVRYIPSTCDDGPMRARSCGMNACVTTIQMHVYDVSIIHMHVCPSYA